MTTVLLLRLHSGACHFSFSPDCCGRGPRTVGMEVGEAGSLEELALEGSVLPSTSGPGREGCPCMAGGLDTAPGGRTREQPFPGPAAGVGAGGGRTCIWASPGDSSDAHVIAGEGQQPLPGLLACGCGAQRPPVLALHHPQTLPRSALPATRFACSPPGPPPQRRGCSPGHREHSRAHW